MKEIAVIKQLPVITEKIKEVGKKLDERFEKLDIDNLVCDEESKKELKELKAELGKEFKEFETQRKEIKNKIMKPYESFNKTYEEEIKVKYQKADKTLGEKINEVESELKHQKELELVDYFEELAKSNNIDFVEFHQMNLNITLTASLKSLKEEIKKFIDGILKDLDIINTQDYKEEILIEYQKELKLNESILDVVNRHKKLDELATKKDNDEDIIKKVDEVLEAPVEEEERKDFEEEVFETKFLIRGTLTQIKEVKKYLENGGYEYESITD